MLGRFSYAGPMPRRATGDGRHPKTFTISVVLPEARAALERTGARFPEQDRRFVQQRPPWLRPEDYALRSEGLRLAAGETS